VAGALFASLRDACAAEWRDYTRHPFLTSLATGSLAKPAFRTYLIQDYIFLRHFARVYGLAAYKSESLAEIRAASKGLSAIIDVEIDLHEKYCAGWGLDASDLENAEEYDATLAYTDYVLERGMAGDLLDLHVALAPCIVGYGEIGARLLADKNTRLEGNPYRDWIDMYGGTEYQQIAAAAAQYLDIIAEGRNAAARQLDLIATFRQATRLETDFWQMGLDAAGA